MVEILKDASIGLYRHTLSNQYFIKIIAKNVCLYFHVHRDKAMELSRVESIEILDVGYIDVNNIIA